MKNFSLFLFFLFQFFLLSAQEIPLGHWRDELPYNQLIAITESEDFVYAATPYGLLSYTKKEGSLDRISKVNGLSDFGISTINYNQAYHTLFIAYSNANIDMIKNGDIVNLSDIKRKSILGNKQINAVFFIDQYAYLSCGFGIVLVDIEREEIKDTYYLGNQGENVEVFDMDRLGDELFVATSKGVYRANINNPNLANFANWTKLSHLPFPDDPYNHMVAFSDHLIVNRLTDVPGDQLFATTAHTWFEVFKQQITKTTNLVADQTHLYLFHPHAIDEYNADFSWNQEIEAYHLSNAAEPQPSALIRSSDGNFYIADQKQGLLISPDLQAFQSALLNGPYSNQVFDISVVGSKLVVASGGRDDSFGNVYLEDGLFVYDDGLWENINKQNTPALDSVYDFVCVDVNPNNSNEFAVGTWGKGLYTFDEGGFAEAYGRQNSSLTPNSTYGHIMRLGGVGYDSKNNLWVASAVSNALLHKRSPSGEWKAFEFGAWTSSYDIRDMLIDSRDYVWILLRSGGSVLLFAFDENQDVNQQIKGLNQQARTGNIPGSQVFSIAQDLDGEIWLGTDEGIGVIYQPENIFRGGDFDAQKIIVERDGYAQYLLESEKVKAIAVDGANRKWVGTERAGVFLLSADGQEELLHFTTDNSPLYSNSITALGITDQGEVIIGTNQGLIVYKGSATTASAQGFSDVYAYPNPVRPDYFGPIAIKGLTRDAFVKITDISGRLVNEIRSEGGQAIWSGENMEGYRVQTGIYLVFVANTDGSESAVTKIMFIH
ncbi:MAG: hypothetical protein JW857_05100 [Bacteroidales bacterium]|nr:hypothetical protein [Bacteroidales bacterium]